MGAAIATVFTFLISWILNCYEGMKSSNVRIKWKKALFMYSVLCIQAVTIISIQNICVAGIGVLTIIALNWNNILWAKSKWKNLIRKNKT